MCLVGVGFLLVWVERNVSIERNCGTRRLEVEHKPVTHGVPRRSMKAVRVARVLAPPPDAKRPTRVSPWQNTAIQRPTVRVASCLMTLTISISLLELAREVVRVKASPLEKKRTAKPATEECHWFQIRAETHTSSGRRRRLRNSNDCFLQVGKHHHSFVLQCWIVGRHPATLVPVKLPKFHRCLTRWRWLTPAPVKQCQHMFGKGSLHNAPASTNLSWLLSLSSHW